MKNIRGSILACGLLLGTGLSAWAQSAPQMPTAGPEQAKLKYFAGDWKSEADMKAGPYGPGGKYTATDHGVMMGDFFVVIHSDGNIPGVGAFKEVAVMSYDGKAGAYSYDAYNSMGEHDLSKGTVEGDTWTWTSTQEMGGKMMMGRFTMKIVSPTSYTYKYEVSEDGNSWRNVMEGKATKI